MVRQSREFEISRDGVTVRARVPTRYEVQRFFAGSPEGGMGDLAMRFVVGWSGVKVKDVLGHGDDESEAPFSPELFANFAGERLELLADVVDGLLSRQKKRQAEIEGEAKN